MPEASADPSHESAGMAALQPDLPISRVQMIQLQAMARDQGWTREDRLHIASILLGQDVHSYKDLTFQQAQHLIWAFRGYTEISVFNAYVRGGTQPPSPA